MLRVLTPALSVFYFLTNAEETGQANNCGSFSKFVVQPRSITWARIWAQWGLRVCSFPPKSPGSQGRQNSPGDGGNLRSIPSETAARRKRREHLGSLPLEGAGRPPGLFQPVWLRLRAEGLSGFTEIELGTAPKRQQSQPAPFSTCRSHSSVGSTPDDAAAPRGTFTLQAASAYVVVVHRVKACTSGEGLLPASSAPARLRWARPAQARTGDQCFHGHHGTES